MKNKILIIILACVLIVSFALGATGAVTFAMEGSADSSNETSRDRFIGVFITTENLDIYQGKLYAELAEDPDADTETVTPPKYVFEGIDGISYFVAQYSDEAITYWGPNGDDAVSDSNIGYHSAGAADSIDMKGTIYISTAKAPYVFYYNPVYQTDSGEVYLMSGQGVRHGGELSAGMSGSYTFKEEQTVAVNGESEAVTSSIEVSTCFMDTPVSTSVLQFGKEGSVVSKEDYAAGDLPLEIATSSDAEYIIAETHMKSPNGEETVTRVLFQAGDETLFAFYCREDGICIKQYCSIAWN